MTIKLKRKRLTYEVPASSIFSFPEGDPNGCLRSNAKYRVEGIISEYGILYIRKGEKIRIVLVSE